MFTQCPECKDQSIGQHERAPGLFIWVAKGWIDLDEGFEVEVDYCPYCGTELQDSDEFGKLPPMPINVDQTDQIEQVLASCTHPRVANGWCNQCGAQQCGDNWLLPHWRDLLIPSNIESLPTIK